MKTLIKPSKSIGLIFINFLIILGFQTSIAQTIFVEYGREIEEYTSSGKIIGCGVSFNGMNEDGLFVQGSLSTLLSIETENIVHILKVEAFSIDLEHLLKTGEYKQTEIPLEFSFLQLTLYPGQAKQREFGTSDWDVTSPPDEEYFLSATAMNDDVGGATVIMIGTEFFVYLKPKGNIIDEKYKIPSPSENEFKQNLTKLLKCMGEFQNTAEYYFPNQ